LFFNTTSGTVNPLDGINGTGGTGYLATLSLGNKDSGYLIYPNYGLKVWNWASDNPTTPYSGALKLNYQNNTLTPKFLVTTDNYTADASQLYYKGVEQVYYDYY